MSTQQTQTTTTVESETNSTETDTVDATQISCDCTQCSANAQPLDRSQEKELRTKDADAIEAIAVASSADTCWIDSEGDILSGPNADARAFSLQHDRNHPASPRTQFSTQASQVQKRQRAFTVDVTQTYNQFTGLPTHVTRDDVLTVARDIPTDGLAPYGGRQFVAVIALVEACHWSNEDLFQNDWFKTQFSQVVVDDAQVSYAKAFRKLCEVRGEVFGQ